MRELLRIELYFLNDEFTSLFRPIISDLRRFDKEFPVQDVSWRLERASTFLSFVGIKYTNYIEF
jgi:hypothetical protein